MLIEMQRRSPPVPSHLLLPTPQPDVPSATAPPADAAAAMPLADWDALFGAVAERLQRLVGGTDGGGAEQRPGAATIAALGECVAALRQLQRQLEPGQYGPRSLRSELAAVQAQLTGTRAELAQTQIDRQHAEHLARHDPLTCLPNRSHFQERLSGSLDGGAALAVLYLDLDGFKRINDTHGHAAGDATLCIVAQRLARALRAQDLVCRMGGDEFACLLVAPPGRDQLCRLACKLFDAVAAPLRVGEITVSVQPSIGIALYPGDGDSGATLLQRADAAMFRAKRRQQGYAFFEARRDL